MRQLIVALILLGSVLAIGPAQSTAAAPAGVYYVMSTVSVIPSICDPLNCDTLPAGTVSYDYSGDGGCVGCLPPNPVQGSFSLTLVGERYLPPNPVRPKSGTGTLSVLWSDSTTTIATYTFKARDSKAYSLNGKVTGGTSSRFATGTAIDGLVGYPIDPIAPGTTSGAVRFG
jgi:hypothetical protein